MSSSSNNNNNDDVDEGNNDSLPRIEGSVSVGKTKWLELRTCTYTDQEGVERKWDYATRTTKQSKHSADAVIVVALLQSSKSNNNTMDTLLVEQFRPPVGQATFEFPAGLIDKDETPEQAALRELKEETGFVGETTNATGGGVSSSIVVSRPVCMSPGLSDETVQVVMVHVDLDRPENQNPKATPDAGEHIKVHRVSLTDGFQTLLDKGTSPMAIEGLYLFAMGLQVGKSMR